MTPRVPMTITRATATAIRGFMAIVYVAKGRPPRRSFAPAPEGRQNVAPRVSVGFVGGEHQPRRVDRTNCAIRASYSVAPTGLFVAPGEDPGLTTRATFFRPSGAGDRLSETGRQAVLAAQSRHDLTPAHNRTSARA